MITFIREFCGACYDDPKQGFALVWLVVRMVLSVIIGATIYGLAELYAWINKENKE